MSDYDRSIHSNPDAAAWAAFFIKTWREIRSDEPPDEGWMLGWFATAMMPMHDFRAAKHAAALDEARGVIRERVYLWDEFHGTMEEYEERCGEWEIRARAALNKRVTKP